jgi:subtilisin family serine protease
MRYGRLFWSAGSALALLVLAACEGLDDPSAPAGGPGDLTVASARVAGQAAASGRFIIRGEGGQLPADLEAQVSARGGTVTGTVPQIGVAFASGGIDFAASAGTITGVAAVMPDAYVAWIPADVPGTEVVANTDDPPTSGQDDGFYDLQWGAAAIDHPEALDAGYTGAGVRACILDSGIRSTHVDLAPNLNAALSTSFATGELFDNPAGSHGTHVSGIVGAADNGIGTIGVAPGVELVMIKVLRFTGSGSFSWLIDGLVYAADIDCDVVNMSLGAAFPQRGFFDANGDWVPASAIAELKNAIQDALTYAYDSGTTLIASAGNSAIDGNKDKSLLHLPSTLAHVISISATGPVGWAVDFDTELDRLASYSNYGSSEIDFAAPGGDFVLPGNDLCTIAPVTVPCWVFDLVLSTSSGGDFSYAWNAGTSMASPHAAGVAALIIGKNGGSMPPDEVEAELRRSADAVGKGGKSSFFGHGRVNAARAVGAS